MKNILIIVPGLGAGGQEQVAIKTADILSQDYNVYFCVFDLSNAVYETNFDIINLNLPTRPSLLGKVINVIRRRRELKNIIKNLKIDITMSFGTTANMVNSLAKKSNQVIVSVRGYRSVANKFSISRLVYLRADKVICVSKKISKDLSNRYSIPVKKVETLYNPYDFVDIEQQSAQNITHDIAGPVIVSMGRLDNVKGYRHLLNSTKLAVESIPNLNLIIIGEGKERESLKKHAINLGIEQNVSFVGFQKNPYSFLSKCSLYVLTSINEGFPNALVEAMICGLPVVATDCKTGPREILASNYQDKIIRQAEYSDYGVLVPSFSSDFSNEYEKDLELSKVIIKMLTNNDLYINYRKEAKVRSKHFSIETYKNKLINIIEEKEIS